MSGHPCPDGEICKLAHNDELEEYHSYCGDPEPGPFVDAGQPCGFQPDTDETNYCKPGFACVSKDRTDIPCSFTHCCTPFCDLAVPPSCPMDLACEPFFRGFRPTEPSLSWLGICIPP